MSKRLKVAITILSIVGSIASVFSLVSFSPSNQTSGPQSPIINNTGPQTINIGNQFDISDNKNLIRFNYYRMKGLSATFLVKGMLSPEWEKTLGGQHEIVNNNILLETKLLINKFSEPPYGYMINSSDTNESIISLDDYAKTISVEKYNFQEKTKSNSKWDLYLGGRSNYDILIPDIEAINTVFKEQVFPDNYKVSSKFGYPIIWRDLTYNDLIYYEANIEKYYKTVLKECGDCYNISTENILPLKIVEGLKYLTKDGIPSGFLTVIGGLGTHGGWGLKTTLRDIEVEVVVFENISSKPISIGEFSFSKATSKGLIEYHIINKLLSNNVDVKENIYPARYLKPNEKIVVPIRLNLVRADASEFEKSNIIKKIKSGKLHDTAFNFRGNLIDFYHPQNLFLFSKDINQFQTNIVPDIPERFTFGNAISPKAIEINDEKIEIRKAEWKNFNYYLSNEKGSCPFVYTKGTEENLWLCEGHMLLGATKKELERTDTINLKNFDGNIQVRENEDEIAFISALKVSLIAGGKKVKEINYSINDNNIVTREKPCNFSHDLGNIKFDEAILSMSGYYLPFDNISVQKSIVY